MNRKTQLAVLMAAAATIGMARAASAQGFDEPLLAAYGQFEIEPGQTKTLAHGKHDRAYRICVRSTNHSVPLKVLYDGQESMVFPGDCTDVEGMHVQIQPGEKLNPGMALFGQYERVGENAPN